MKILHTADWHLGKRLERFSRLPEQKAVLQEICRIADAERVDAVVIAGDLFDAYNPSSEAVELFYQTLKQLAAGGQRAVVAIAGNHDSPDRIEAPEPLARECGIILVGYPHSRLPCFRLPGGLAVTRSEAGFLELQLPHCPFPLRLLLTPYANEVRMRACLGFDDPEKELRLLLQEQWQQLAARYCDEGGVNILLAHLFLMQRGAPPPEEPEDEKSILHIGGAAAIFAENVPEQIQYVALGHLHRHQTVSNSPCPMVYSSSPLAYSMSEAEQTKQVVIVEGEAGKPLTVREVPLSAGKQLLRCSFSSVDAAVRWLEAHPEALVEISITTDTFLSAEDNTTLHRAHDGIVAVIPVVENELSGGNSDGPVIDMEKNMEELFSDYFRYREGKKPPRQILELLKEVLAAENE